MSVQWSTKIELKVWNEGKRLKSNPENVVDESERKGTRTIQYPRILIRRAKG